MIPSHNVNCIIVWDPHVVKRNNKKRYIYQMHKRIVSLSDLIESLAIKQPLAKACEMGIGNLIFEQGSMEGSSSRM